MTYANILAQNTLLEFKDASKILAEIPPQRL